jgi:hypothetical protein
MERKVQIIEKESLNLIAEYLIDLEDNDSNEADLAEAWMNAVDDGIVDSANEMDFEMKFVEGVPAE